jgi:hypothetical protein
MFGDLSTLTYLLMDANAQPSVDLSQEDDDGLSLVDIAIYGFGSDSEREVEREECVRLLVSQGADVNHADHGTSPSRAWIREALNADDYAQPSGLRCTMQRSSRLLPSFRIFSPMDPLHSPSHNAV